MKRSGYTLLETVVVMSIIALLAASCLSLKNVESNIYNDLEIDGCLYEIQDLFTYAKLRCKEQNESGTVILDFNDNTMYFVNDNRIIEKYYNIPKNIKLGTMQTNFPITSNGIIKVAGTISIVNVLRTTNKVTISVGVDKITIKKGSD